jgi:hypothetical protein
MPETPPPHTHTPKQAVWGTCSSVTQLASLVPPSTRSNCFAAMSESACAIAAPLCKWEAVITDPLAMRPGPGEKPWPTSQCATTCTTADKPTCDKYRKDCVWDKTVMACAVYNGTIPREEEEAAPPARPEVEPIAPLDRAPVAPRGDGAGCGQASATNVSCTVDSALGDAAYTLIQMSKASAMEENNEVPQGRPQNGAFAVRGATAAAAALAAAAVLLL